MKKRKKLFIVLILYILMLLGGIINDVVAYSRPVVNSAPLDLVILGHSLIITVVFAVIAVVVCFVPAIFEKKKG